MDWSNYLMSRYITEIRSFMYFNYDAQKNVLIQDGKTNLFRIRTIFCIKCFCIENYCYYIRTCIIQECWICWDYFGFIEWHYKHFYNIFIESMGRYFHIQSKKCLNQKRCINNIIIIIVYYGIINVDRWDILFNETILHGFMVT